jgi:hypothetical protein
MNRILSLIAISLIVSCKSESQPPTKADDPNLVKRVELLEQRVEQLLSEREMEKAIREAEKNGFRTKAIFPSKDSSGSN